MATTLTVQMTKQGLLLPRAALGDWHTQELEVVRGRECIVIRPRPAADSRSQVRLVLQDAGLLYEPQGEPLPPVSEEERAELARKLSRGRPLSEIIIEERRAGW